MISYENYIGKLKESRPKINFDQVFAQVFHKRIYYFPKLAMAAALTVFVVFLSLFGVQSSYQASKSDDILMSYVFDSDQSSGAVVVDYVFDN